MKFIILWLTLNLKGRFLNNHCKRSKNKYLLTKSINQKAARASALNTV
jgi:hypothetical protein